MLVIHPYDKTTDFLRTLYKGREDVRLLSGKESRKELGSILFHLRPGEPVMLLGHGSDAGLFRRSIREKLLCYFRQLAESSGKNTFTLPFSLSTLADYIATDRSAMMRELKRLREEGVVSSDGRKFTLNS